VRGTGAPRDVDLRSLIARLTTIRQIHASTDRSSFARGRARSADANASWTTSRAVSASPAMACATRRKRGEARAVNRLELLCRDRSRLPRHLCERDAGDGEIL
jgi:hypothetical protein